MDLAALTKAGKTVGMRRLIFIAALAGCTSTSAPPPGSPLRVEDTCGATRFADLIGQDATALERRLHMGMVRVIRPGDAVTMDFRAERINFKIGEDEKIQAVDCG